MKKLAIVALAFAASLSAADYSGIWNGKGLLQSARYPGGVPYTLQITLLQAGTALQGTIKLGNNTPFTISSGTVSGTAVTLAAAPGNAQITAKLSAASASQLSGTMTTSDGKVFEVGLTKQ